MEAFQNWLVINNHTDEVAVRNDSVLGSYNASFLICNSDFGDGGADTITFFSDAHVFTFLTLYKQSKKIIDFSILTIDAHRGGEVGRVNIIPPSGKYQNNC